MTTKPWILTIAVTSVAAVAAAVYTVRRFQSTPVESARRSVLTSAVLGEQREYDVYLPERYATDTGVRYPVLYVLDGELQAQHTAESAWLLARIGVIPRIIVVGIASVDNDRRDRDFTPPGNWHAVERRGGAARFVSFLETELIGRVETEYRTTRPRILAGWSRGGLFILYSQIAAPSLFDGRFGLSPFVWGEEDEPAVTNFEEGMRMATPSPAFLYLSLGDQDVQTTAPFKHLIRVLESHAPSTLRWRSDFSVGGDHNSNPRLSTPVALCEMFAPTTHQACRTKAGPDH